MTRVPYSTQVSPDVLGRVRATVLGLQRNDPTVTIAKFTEEALEAWCERQEAQANDGAPWPPSTQGPRRGRRLDA